ncbi:zinc finger protein 362a isoform X1 [Dunckerocampus dactyliophorus]|uniref:zinc finger protein 362a isoform X1 n=1 Tax=Dunckerocampus dactyliophorus TaxID=161453 RepID=UPI002405FC75|nr:zinc finger protein 362a isoform X1 [Dunckerocampus dactyliophorus]
MAEPRFNSPYFWPPPPAMAVSQEQLMAEKIRAPHPPTTTLPSQHTLLTPPSQEDGGQHEMSKAQHTPGLNRPSQGDVVLHASPARPASSSLTGRILGDVNLNLDDKAAIKARGLWEDWRQLIDHPARTNHLSGVSLASRTGNLSNSEVTAPTTPSPSSPARLVGGASTPHLLSGFSSPHGVEPARTNGGLLGLLGGSKPREGRRRIKAENGSSLLVVPYPIMASSNDQSCITITAKEKTYRCKVCPLTFFSKSDMQIHSKTHTEAKAYKCPHCTKTFANAPYLAQHLRIHLGLKPYRCSYCEKSFRQLSHLQQHTRIHTGDRPYKCFQPGCEKAFTQLSNLQSHQRHHNKDKPFKCSNCYRAYSDSASLQIHLSAHAIKAARAYCCSTCDRAYTSETYLMKHMCKRSAVHHGGPRHSAERRADPALHPRTDSSDLSASILSRHHLSLAV